jgi:uncharacterized protein (DUF2267 family)
LQRRVLRLERDQYAMRMVKVVWRFAREFLMALRLEGTAAQLPAVERALDSRAVIPPQRIDCLHSNEPRHARGRGFRERALESFHR